MTCPCTTRSTAAACRFSLCMARVWIIERSPAPLSRSSVTSPVFGACTRTCRGWAAPRRRKRSRATTTSWTCCSGSSTALWVEPFLVIGHSYGGYLAGAIAGLKPEQAAGLALICPVGAHTLDVSSAGLPAGLDPDLEATYRDYFVVQTAETPRRFQERVAPSVELVDEPGLTRILSHASLLSGSRGYVSGARAGRRWSVVDGLCPGASGGRRTSVRHVA